ncbi:hypothetical protein E2C01_059051 [Portunus trituberculatus]|uniref:Uncharacterized protein n=1 Tax=Portunus trituberculatus TaxID=210409 RepID=A0A5B7H518_PORTR|nr:hypothetical protein [Portunus trituberculatus]
MKSLAALTVSPEGWPQRPGSGGEVGTSVLGTGSVQLRIMGWLELSRDLAVLEAAAPSPRRTALRSRRCTARLPPSLLCFFLLSCHYCLPLSRPVPRVFLFFILLLFVLLSPCSGSRCEVSELRHFEAKFLI